MTTDRKFHTRVNQPNTLAYCDGLELKANSYAVLVIPLLQAVAHCHQVTIVHSVTFAPIYSGSGDFTSLYSASWVVIIIFLPSTVFLVRFLFLISFVILFLSNPSESVTAAFLALQLIEFHSDHGDCLAKVLARQLLCFHHFQGCLFQRQSCRELLCSRWLASEERGVPA